MLVLVLRLTLDHLSFGQRFQFKIWMYLAGSLEIAKLERRSVFVAQKYQKLKMGEN